MLIEFRVKNFRSLRNEHVFSLVASEDKTLRDTNTQATNTKAVPALLRSAVIYGANSAGKSNLIKALQYMVYVISTSAQKPSEEHFNIKPFLLDNYSPNNPSEFEVTFILDDVRYQYGFALTAQRIISEYLLVYQAFKAQHWFERSFDFTTNKDVYKFSSSLKGKKSLWESATRPNSLFLSMAVQLNSKQLQPIVHWFMNNLVIIGDHHFFNMDFTIEKLKDPDSKKNILNFLQAADTNITNIEGIKHKVPLNSIQFNDATKETKITPMDGADYEFRFHHSTKTAHAVFGLNDESKGTGKLFFFTPPLLHFLERGLTVVVDELDSSLHILLVQKLVRLFHSSRSNTNGAQLIFTTHNTSLLDAPHLFRRDQIWFVEKNSEQASELYSLLDFSPRKNEALEKGYLAGRYGGLPLLTDGD
ncbi:phage resistance protein [Candidatus Megaera polyxenophila]|nr:phage resistance protein [Candidatus Megaera polyxenophila]